ncbi:MAG: PAS domain S-box protein [Phycisphaerae bacterium]|nr:PAS domain S-box protein [Phycisphaerae bacterium]
MMEKKENKSYGELVSQIDDLRLRLREIEDSLSQVSSGSDIDSASHLEKNLIRSQYSIEHAIDAIFWVNSEGGFEYVNNSACQSLGYTRQELLGMSIFDINLFFTNDSWPEHWKLVRDEGSRLIEARHRAKGGKVFHVEIAINYVKFDDVEYNCAFARDISKRKKTELALYLSEQRFRAIADYTYDWELWLSPGGRVLWTNPGVERVCGYTVEESMAMYDYPMSIICQEDRQAVKEAFMLADEGQSGSGLEVHLRRKDGQIIWVSISWMPIYDQKGVSQGYRASIRDITLRKNVQLEREELFKSIEAKNEELESIVYVSSHDLRTPLVNIQGFGGEITLNCGEMRELLEDVDMPRKVRMRLAEILDIEFPQSLDFISSSAKKIDSLLDGLLKLSRIARAPLVVEPLDMNELVDGILRNLESQIKGSGVVVSVERLPKCSADSIQVNQIFTNLIDNALKYLDPNKKGAIRVSGVTTDGFSVYCIEDNGIGIAPEYAEVIFEAFQRVSHEKLIGGEGLGLTIVKRLAARNNGRVRLESEPSVGSKFYIALPTAGNSIIE